MEVGVPVDERSRLEHPPEVQTTIEPVPSTTGTSRRFVFVDGLRGLAALSILVFHIWWYEPHPYPAFDSPYWIIDPAFLRLRGGVQVLLVISGFVIAYSLRNVWVTSAEVINFIGRRLIRLVPAYWCAIAAVILVNFICRILGDLSAPFEGELSLVRVLSHMVFMQDVSGHDPLGAGMWTLCIEMQFYFVAVIGWGLAQSLFRRPVPDEPRPSAIALMAVFATLGFASLFRWRIQEDLDDWVIHFLWMFFLGMSTWWALDRTIRPRVYFGIVAVALLELTISKGNIEDDWHFRYSNGVALATSLAIFAAGRRDRLHTLLDWPRLQYLGRISYSLYLIHFPVCHLLTTIGWNWCGNSPTPLQARTILLISFVASFVAGHLLYVLVEAPSVRWAARTKIPIAERQPVKLPNKPR